MSSPPVPLSQLDQLETRVGSSWQSIRKARSETQNRRDDLANLFAQHGSPDTPTRALIRHIKGETVEATIDSGARLVKREEIDTPTLKELLFPDIQKFLQPGAKAH